MAKTTNAERVLLTLKQLGLDSGDADLVVEAWDNIGRTLMVYDEGFEVNRPVVTITPNQQVPGYDYEVVIYREGEDIERGEIPVESITSRLFLIANLADED